MVNEVHDIAGQHEVIAENLNTSIVKEVMALIQEVKQERKKVCIQSIIIIIVMTCLAPT